MKKLAIVIASLCFTLLIACTSSPSSTVEEPSKVASDSVSLQQNYYGAQTIEVDPNNTTDEIKAAIAYVEEAREAITYGMSEEEFALASEKLNNAILHLRELVYSQADS